MTTAISDRWILGRDVNGPHNYVAWQVHPTVIRVYEEMWEHTCLDIDLESRVFVERDQESNTSDNPDDWVQRIRRADFVDGAWLICLEDVDCLTWVKNWETAVAHFHDFGTRFPHHARMAKANADAAQALLDFARALRPGWTPVVPEVGQLIDTRGERPT